MESKHLEQFFEYITAQNIEVYNEFSLQHELGIFLRTTLPQYKIQFERNVSYFGISETVKKEIDISIVGDKDRYAVELKYPTNGQYPEQLYSFVKDIKFMEQLKEQGFSKTFSVALVGDRPFYEGRDNSGIYDFFRESRIVRGRIYKPTGQLKNSGFIEIAGEYPISWRLLGDRRYFIVEI
ncbi:hypothetical protein P4H46_25520 [Paenibacillus glucanolyticus]|uniref:hypothetical protein n=1 Tax=Paenibacillus glucanolyticus TaxID=59843 RepID=UPI0030C94CD6